MRQDGVVNLVPRNLTPSRQGAESAEGVADYDGNDKHRGSQPEGLTPLRRLPRSAQREKSHAALDQLAGEGYPIQPEDVARLSLLVSSISTCWGAMPSRF